MTPPMLTPSSLTPAPLTPAQVDLVRAKIAEYRWDKHSYAYAIGAMDSHSVYSLYYQSFKKQEVVDKFYELVVTKFHRIQSFATFKNLVLN